MDDAGPVVVPSADQRWSFHVDEGSAGVLRETICETGALVGGRHLFDHIRGWGGNYPMGVQRSW